MQNSGCLRPLLIGIVVLTSFSVAAWYILFSTGLYEPPSKVEKAIFFENAWIWDGSADSIQLGNVMVEDGTITCVGGDCVPPKGIKKMDAKGKSLMPGMIDLHVHYYAPSQENQGMNAFQQFPDYVKQRPSVRRNFVKHGVTSIRCVGDITDNILQLKQQWREGKLAGPRVYVTGAFLTSPGGHPVSTWFKGNDMLIQNATIQLDGPQAAREAVALLAAKGVDGLKVIYTKGEDRDLPILDEEVLDAILEEAPQAGLWVSVHCLHSDEVASFAERSVTNLEQISFATIDSATASQLLENDIAIVPSLVADSAEFIPDLAFLEELGLLIGTGSDTKGDMRFGKSLLEEIRLLHEKAGLSKADALRAATLDAARILRIDDQVGRIAVGKRADLVLLDGNVLEQLPERERINSVIIDGKVLMWNGTLFE
ncbi:MAG: amidohydrolase family protein [Bacteroidota bacterium]